MKSENP